MLGCFLSVGLICFSGSDLTVELPQTVLAYRGTVRTADTELEFLLATDEMDPPPQLPLEKCLDGRCFTYGARWFDPSHDQRWTDARGPFGVEITVGSAALSEHQGFRLTGTSREAVIRFMHQMSVRITGTEQLVPLESLTIETAP